MCHDLVSGKYAYGLCANQGAVCAASTPLLTRSSWRTTMKRRSSTRFANLLVLFITADYPGDYPWDKPPRKDVKRR